MLWLESGRLGEQTVQGLESCRLWLRKGSAHTQVVQTRLNMQLHRVASFRKFVVVVAGLAKHFRCLVCAYREGYRQTCVQGGVVQRMLHQTLI